MAVALVAGFMTLLDVSIVNVALPSIRTDLHLSSSELQWVLSGYALTFGLLLVPAGRFGDARGRRNVFIAGLVVFTLASAGAGLATSATWLVVARLMQGAAAGVVNPQVSGLIQQLFEPRERGRPFGLLGATIGISTAVGPLLGGLLIQVFGAEEGWRWIFYINVPIGLVAIVLGLRWIPARAGETSPARAGETSPARAGETSPARAGETSPARAGETGEAGARPAAEKARESLDPVGVVLLGAAVILLLLPLVQEREWHGQAKWLLIVAALAVMSGFIAWERHFGRSATALVDLELFKRRSYGLGAIIGLLYFGGFTSIFFTFTLLLQSGLHYSALEAGLAVTPFALGSAGASAIGGRVVNRFGRPLVVIGLILVIAGLIATDLVVEHGGWATAIPLLIAGLGSGLVISPNQTLTLAEVPVRRAGSAGAVLQTGQRIGTAVGIAAVGAVFFNRLAHHGGDWVPAFRTSLGVTIAFVAVALIAAFVDVVKDRNDARLGKSSSIMSNRRG
jgi:MFS family permease